MPEFILRCLKGRAASRPRSDSAQAGGLGAVMLRGCDNRARISCPAASCAAARRSSRSSASSACMMSRIAVDLERAVLLDRAHALFLDVAGDDAGKRAAQIRGEPMRRLAAMQVRARPSPRASARTAAGIRSSMCSAQLKKNASLVSRRWLRTRSMPLRTCARDFARIVDDDAGSAAATSSPSARRRKRSICSKYARRFARAGEDQRERQVRVVRVQQDAEQVEDFLGRADAAGEHDDAVADAHERFEALLDVRHDHQVVDDRVRRFGGDDAGLGDADVAVVAAALLGVRDGRALHRPLHRARAAAGADVERRAGRARSRPAWCSRIRRARSNGRPSTRRGSGRRSAAARARCAGSRTPRG